MNGHGWTVEAARAEPGRVVLTMWCQCGQWWVSVAGSVREARRKAKRKGRDHAGFALLARGTEGTA